MLFEPMIEHLQVESADLLVVLGYYDGNEEMFIIAKFDDSIAAHPKADFTQFYFLFSDDSKQFGLGEHFGLNNQEFYTRMTANEEYRNLLLEWDKRFNIPTLAELAERAAKEARTQTSGSSFESSKSRVSKEILDQSAGGSRIYFAQSAVGRGNAIPDWVRNNAGWWADGTITDTDFFNGIRFLIEEEVLAIDPEVLASQGKVAAEWDPGILEEIKQIAGRWADGTATDTDFLHGIQWLIERGFLAVDTGEQGAVCETNEECSAEQFCKKPDGQCDGTGTCHDREFYCIQLALPVCGCDGKDYMSFCDANQAPVPTNVLHEGECVKEDAKDVVSKSESACVNPLIGDDQRVSCVEPNGPSLLSNAVVGEAKVYFALDEDGESVEIPEWVRNNAGWWAEGAIDDTAFKQGIAYLIEEGIIRVNVPDGGGNADAIDAPIPDWIKNNAQWWAEGSLDDTAFLQGISYMVEHGLIRVGGQDTAQQDSGSVQAGQQTSRIFFSLPYPVKDNLTEEDYFLLESFDSPRPEQDDFEGFKPQGWKFSGSHVADPYKNMFSEDGYSGKALLLQSAAGGNVSSQVEVSVGRRLGPEEKGGKRHWKYGYFRNPNIVTADLSGFAYLFYRVKSLDNDPTRTVSIAWETDVAATSSASHHNRIIEQQVETQVTLAEAFSDGAEGGWTEVYVPLDVTGFDLLGKHWMDESIASYHIQIHSEEEKSAARGVLIDDIRLIRCSALKNSNAPVGGCRPPVADTHSAPEGAELLSDFEGTVDDTFYLIRPSSWRYLDVDIPPNPALGPGHQSAQAIKLETGSRFPSKSGHADEDAVIGVGLTINPDTGRKCRSCEEEPELRVKQWPHYDKLSYWVRSEVKDEGKGRQLGVQLLYREDGEWYYFEQPPEDRPKLDEIYGDWQQFTVSLDEHGFTGLNEVLLDKIKIVEFVLYHNGKVSDRRSVLLDNIYLHPKSTEEPSANTDAGKLLFVGNGYTSDNNLPQLVAEIADSMGIPVNTKLLASPGADFEEHVGNKTTIDAIQRYRPDYVFLQDQSRTPSKLPEQVRDEKLPHAQALVEAVKDSRADAEVVYFVTWGRENGESRGCADYPKVCSFTGHTAALRDGYSIYRTGTGGTLGLVGSAWEAVVDDIDAPFPASDLWEDNGSAPTLLGSYLAANVLFIAAFDTSVVGASYPDGISQEEAEYLQEIAMEVMLGQGGDSSFSTQSIPKHSSATSIANTSKQDSSTIHVSETQEQTVESSRIYFAQSAADSGHAIPDWVRDNAGRWADKQISDEEFVQGIEYLVANEILIVELSRKPITTDMLYIPDWIRTNARWWAKKQISDKDFISGIRYLIENGVVNLDLEYSPSEPKALPGTQCEACLEEGGTWQPEISACTPDCDIADVSCFRSECPGVCSSSSCENCFSASSCQEANCTWNQAAEAMWCSAQSTVGSSEYVFKFFLDPVLVSSSLDESFVKKSLVQYVDDMNKILAKNTNRRLVFDPESGVVVTKDKDAVLTGSEPLIGGMSRQTGFEIWAHVSTSYTLASGFDETIRTAPSGAVILTGAWGRIYDPVDLTTGGNSYDQNQYFRQIEGLLHGFANVFGAGLGEYASLGEVQDRTGVDPVVPISLSQFSEGKPDSFWERHEDFLADPLRGGRLDEPTDIDSLRYADVTAAVISADVSAVDETVPDLSNIVLQIVDADTGEPIPQAHVQIWSVAAGLNSLAEKRVDSTADDLGQYTWAWGDTHNNPDLGFSNWDNLRLIKVHQPGYHSAARWESIYDAQAVKMLEGKDDYAIVLELAPDRDAAQ